MLDTFLVFIWKEKHFFFRAKIMLYVISPKP